MKSWALVSKQNYNFSKMGWAPKCQLYSSYRMSSHRNNEEKVTVLLYAGSNIYEGKSLSVDDTVSCQSEKICVTKRQRDNWYKEVAPHKCAQTSCCTKRPHKQTGYLSCDCIVGTHWHTFLDLTLWNQDTPSISLIRCHGNKLYLKAINMSNIYLHMLECRTVWPCDITRCSWQL